MNRKKEELERICFNCSNFYLEPTEEFTEFGICLNDQAFEPFLEKLLENFDYAPCQDLVNQKKFSGEQEACVDFEEAEIIEIDDDSPLAKHLLEFSKTGKLDLESLKLDILKEKIELLIGKQHR